MMWCINASRCAKTLAAFMFTILASHPDSRASDSATAEFSALISDGSCELSLSDTMLDFATYRATAIPVAGTAAVRALTANIRCSGATTPTLSVSGPVLLSSTMPRSVIFRDGDSVATGVGFMVRRDTGGINTSNFYNTDAALANGENVTLSAVQGDTVHHESLLIGLVRAGSETVTPGSIKARLTLMMSYE